MKIIDSIIQLIDIQKSDEYWISKNQILAIQN